MAKVGAFGKFFIARGSDGGGIEDGWAVGVDNLVETEEGGNSTSFPDADSIGLAGVRERGGVGGTAVRWRATSSFRRSAAARSWKNVSWVSGLSMIMALSFSAAGDIRGSGDFGGSDMTIALVSRFGLG